VHRRLAALPLLRPRRCRGRRHILAGAKQDKPFYVWASTIVDGQIVATDYAPDTGWLRPTPAGTNPGGTYVLTGKFLDGPAPFRLSMTVPQGWSTAGPTLEPPNASGTSLRFLNANHPAEWACDTSGHSIKPRVGPAVDDLVSFLSHQPRLTISKNTDITVDGHNGIYLEYTTSYDDNTNCVPTDWPFDAAAFHQLWILDVDHLRLVIDASAPKVSEATKAEFSQIVDSIAFEPPTTLEAAPTPAPTPLPTPTPTPFPPAAGPVPHGARPWEVTVEKQELQARDPVPREGTLQRRWRPVRVRDPRRRARRRHRDRDLTCSLRRA
jgi:hypothetical protein